MADNGTPGIDVRMDGGTVWLTQAQMAELFQTTPQNITLHLKSVFAEGELTESATCKDYLQVRQEGARQVERNLRHCSLAVECRAMNHRPSSMMKYASSPRRMCASSY